MKVMLCINQLSKGGAERVVTNLANYLSNNHKVTIVSVRDQGIAYDINKNVKIYFLDNKKAKNPIKKILNRVNKLNTIIKKEKVEAILSFLPMASFLSLFLKKRRKTKVIVSVRNDPKVEYKKIQDFIAMKILYPLADGFVFQTEDARKYFNKKIQNKSAIILNSLNPDFIMDSYKGKREKTIVSVGRLSSQKNHLLLIKAFEKINNDFPEHKLIIYGEGEKREELESYIKEKNLTNFISLPGIENDIKNKIYKSNLFVLSSNYEGLPNALIEALALGIPCISTNCPCGGPKSLIKDDYNGLLTEVGNVDMMAHKIKYILKNEDFAKKIGINASKIKDKLNPNIINKEWEDYLNKIINN